LGRPVQREPHGACGDRLCLLRCLLPAASTGDAFAAAGLSSSSFERRRRFRGKVSSVPIVRGIRTIAEGGRCRPIISSVHGFFTDLQGRWVVGPTNTAVIETVAAGTARPRRVLAAWEGRQSRRKSASLTVPQPMRKVISTLPAPIWCLLTLEPSDFEGGSKRCHLAGHTNRCRILGRILQGTAREFLSFWSDYNCIYKVDQQAPLLHSDVQPQLWRGIQWRRRAGKLRRNSTSLGDDVDQSGMVYIADKTITVSAKIDTTERSPPSPAKERRPAAATAAWLPTPACTTRSMWPQMAMETFSIAEEYTRRVRRVILPEPL